MKIETKKNLTKVDLRRWAISVVATNMCAEAWSDTATICRLAEELIRFVETGEQPADKAPPKECVH